MAEVDRIVKVVADDVVPLVIELPVGGTRVIAEVFERDDGIVFADIGYCDPLYSGHPFHVVTGEITGTGPWKIGNATIRAATAEEGYFDEWQDWRIARDDTKGCTRELARQGIEADGGFD